MRRETVIVLLYTNIRATLRRLVLEPCPASGSTTVCMVHVRAIQQSYKGRSSGLDLKLTLQFLHDIGFNFEIDEFIVDMTISKFYLLYYPELRCLCGSY